ncbi:hypothetical protein RCL1_002000 [Eukaryota sp. TZLM3-RCL]
MNLTEDLIAQKINDLLDNNPNPFEVLYNVPHAQVAHRQDGAYTCFKNTSTLAAPFCNTVSLMAEVDLWPQLIDMVEYAQIVSGEDSLNKVIDVKIKVPFPLIKARLSRVALQLINRRQTDGWIGLYAEGLDLEQVPGVVIAHIRYLAMRVTPNEDLSECKLEVIVEVDPKMTVPHFLLKWLTHFMGNTVYQKFLTAATNLTGEHRLRMESKSALYESFCGSSSH